MRNKRFPLLHRGRVRNKDTQGFVERKRRRKEPIIYTKQSNYRHASRRVGKSLRFRIRIIGIKVRQNIKTGTNEVDEKEKKQHSNWLTFVMSHFQA